MVELEGDAGTYADDHVFKRNARSYPSPQYSHPLTGNKRLALTDGSKLVSEDNMPNKPEAGNRQYMDINQYMYGKEDWQNGLVCVAKNPGVSGRGFTSIDPEDKRPNKPEAGSWQYMDINQYLGNKEDWQDGVVSVAKSPNLSGRAFTSIDPEGMFTAPRSYNSWTMPVASHRPSMPHHIRHNGAVAQPAQIVEHVDYSVRWTQDSTPDLSIHMSLGMQASLEVHLERLAELRRLGRFKTALEVYSRHFDSFGNEPLLALGYADILVDQGNYHHLLKSVQDGTLVFELPPFPETEDPRTLATRKVLEVKWSCLLDQGRRHTHIACDDDFLLWTRAAISHNWGWGSTELSVFVMMLRWIADNNTYSASIDPFLTREYRADWPMLYQNALCDEDVWSCVDMTLAAVLAFGAERAWKLIFRREFFSGDFFVDLKRDWDAHAEDNATLLALVHLLVQTALWLDIQLCFTADDRLFEAMSLCLKEADLLVECLIRKDAASMMTRQYARWILVKVKLRGHQSSRPQGAASTVASDVGDVYSMKYLDNQPGLQLWYTGIPIYLPQEDFDKPEWEASEADADTKSLLETALKVARDMADMDTEALILRELVRRSAQPSKVIGTLATLQKMEQNDLRGYLETLMSVYLVVDLNLLRSNVLPRLKELARFFKNRHAPILLGYSYWIMRMALAGHQKDKFDEKADTFLKRLIRNVESLRLSGGYVSNTTARESQRRRHWKDRKSLKQWERDQMNRWVGLGNILASVQNPGTSTQVVDPDPYTRGGSGQAGFGRYDTGWETDDMADRSPTHQSELEDSLHSSDSGLGDHMASGHSQPRGAVRGRRTVSFDSSGYVRVRTMYTEREQGSEGTDREETTLSDRRGRA